MEKKEYYKYIRFSVILCLIIAGGFLLYLILQFSLNTTQPVGVVMSGSMEPNIHKGDIIIAHGIDAESIQKGDVIIFNAFELWEDAPDSPIVHRVVEKVKLGETWYIQTKGDANSWLDGGLVREDRIIGKVVCTIPYIGIVAVLLIESHVIVSLCIVGLFVYVAVIGARKLIRNIH